MQISSITFRFLKAVEYSGFHRNPSFLRMKLAACRHICLLLLYGLLTSEDGVLSLHLGPGQPAVGQVSHQAWQLRHLWREETSRVMKMYSYSYCTI